MQGRYAAPPVPRGRWRGEITNGRSPQGRRLRRRVSGQSRAAVQDALKELRKEIDGGSTATAQVNFTVRSCREYWLTGGLPGRDPKTVAKNKHVLEPLLAVIGTVRLQDLEVIHDDNALAAVAASRSSSTVAIAHLPLTRTGLLGLAGHAPAHAADSLCATTPSHRPAAADSARRSTPGVTQPPPAPAANRAYLPAR